jgi:hypothetical protein
MQEGFIARSSHLSTHLQSLYDRFFHSYFGMVEEALTHHADPHAKRSERINGWVEAVQHNILSDRIWVNPGSGFIYKMKRMEISKPGKYARGIANLGIAASLQGFRITHLLKCAMASEPLYINGGEIEFCPKPSTKALSEVFRKLINPPLRFYFVYFSDDACLAIRCGETILRFNIDISSCDASHTPSLFTYLRKLVPPEFSDEIDDLILQCTAPVTIRDRLYRKNKLILAPTAPCLYSGSTLTTVINNLANILIGFSISESNILKAEDISSAAMRAGYVVTCDDCTDWHGLQFLKHSPVLDTDNVLRPLLNIGVLLRMIGSCKGDLPGKKTTPIRVRALRFTAALLHGAYPRAHFQLIDNLKERNVEDADLNCEKVVAEALRYKVVHDPDDPVFTVHSNEVYKRYNLTPLEILEIDLGMGSCTYGDHYHSSGTNKIFHLDYGLSGKEFV